MRKFYNLSKRSISKGLFALFACGLFGISNAQSFDWNWAGSFGGTQSDKAAGVVSDVDGNVFVVGTFVSPTINFGDIQLENQGGTDFYLVKYNTEGIPVKAIGIGSFDIEGGMDIDADAAGNIYAIGYFNGGTLTIDDLTLNNKDPNGDTSDFFIAKFNSDVELQWAKSGGSTAGDGANRIAVDAAGNSYITGYYGGNEMFFDTISLITYGAMDMFTAKYDTDGNEVWAVNAGGEDYEQGVAVSVDSNGNSYVTGYYSSPTASFGQTEITNVGINDIYVVKYDGNGVEQWVKSIGGSSYEGGTAISNDETGNVYITGYFASGSLDFGNGVQTTNNGDQSVFIAKFNTNGDAQWANSSKGSGLYMPENISAGLDNGGSVLVGQFNNSTFGFDDLNFTNAGSDDVFLIEFDGNGNAVKSESVGGSGSEQCKGLYVDENNSVYIAGTFTSNSINIGSFELDNSNPATEDVFVAKSGLTMGVSNVSESASIQVYPNPSNGMFSLKSDSNIKSVDVLNMAGQLIFTSKANSKNLEINIQNKTAGVYILRIKTDKGFIIKKVVIKH